MDREAWHAVVHGVAKSWTRLSDWAELSIGSQNFWSQDPFMFLKAIENPPKFSLYIWYFLYYIWLCGSINCGKFRKKWEFQTTWPASWKTCVQVRKRRVRTGCGTTDWFQIGKGVHQGCILSPCLFNLYAEYIMRNAGLDEAQAGTRIARRNINNLRYADDTTLMAESKEELKSLLMKVKEES